MIKYELMYLDKRNRANKKVAYYLHSDFKEFGKSGKVYYKEDILNVELDAFDFKIYNFNQYKLAEDCFLCTYKLLNENNHIVTNRSSIWKYEDNDWKLRFHQGTEVREE